MGITYLHPHNQLELDDPLILFGSPHRLPRRPYCTDDLEAGIRIRSLKQALTKRYIQINPPHLRVWSIYDCDYPGAVFAWYDNNLPMPTWAAVNWENKHAHLVWGLSAPVLMDTLSARSSPMRYLAAIETAIADKINADPGFTGLITKNPAHPHWKLFGGIKDYFTLEELADWLPNLGKHKPKKQQVEQIGLGRNVSLFDSLRRYAYKQIKTYKVAGIANFVYWQSHLYDKALLMNGDFTYPLHSREVWHINKSVAKWVWSRFDIAASDVRFSKLQAFRGAKNLGKTKKRKKLEKVKKVQLWAQNIPENDQ
jgi:hypothetical protein